MNSIFNVFYLMRPHHWIKNLLIFIPITLSNNNLDIDNLFNLLLTFISMSLCASSIYILNDIFDKKDDQLHPQKKTRPYAKGEISTIFALFIFLVLFVISLFLVSFIDNNLIYILLVYLLLNIFYSYILKKIYLLDIILLAFFFTFRILLGGLASDVPISFWLLAFSSSFFFSLATIKRCSELISSNLHKNKTNLNRGYQEDDLNILFIFGVSSGYLSILILILYSTSDNLTKYYDSYLFLGLVVLIVFYWLNRLWLITHRKKMIYDPIIFALKDKVSIFLGLLLIFLFVISKNSYLL